MTRSGFGRVRTVATMATAATAVALVTGGLAPGTSQAAKNGPTIDIQMLAFNDFHGNLESGGNQVAGYSGINPTTGRPIPVNIPSGGTPYLSAYLKQARVGHPYTVTVAAGDIIGASPFLSAAFHDEPTIESMNALGLEVTSVGNHEFDEGATELLRMQNGGCLDDGPDGVNNQNSCPGGKSFGGANFQYLAANVVRESDGSTLFPSYWVKNFNGAKVGFIGMTLKGTPDIVTKSGVAGLQFKDEVETANALVPVLQAQGVQAIVVLIHQGGTPDYKFQGIPTAAPYDFTCDGGANQLTSDSAIIPIAQQLSPAIDVVVSGHTHQPYVCDIKDPAGQDRLVTSASSFGRVYTDIELKFDRRTQDIVRSSVDATNVVVDRNTKNITPDPAEQSIINYYKPFAAPIQNRHLGFISSDLTRVGAPFSAPVSGESQMGDLIADAQHEDSTIQAQGPVQIAFMNPGGIRANLTYLADLTDGDNEGDGVVTFGEAFQVQPFNNYDVSLSLTGAQIKTLLEQQFDGTNHLNLGASNWKILQVSNGFSYSYDATKPLGSFVDPASMMLNGVPIDMNATYRVECNSFLSDGGDGFGVFATGQNKLFGGLDIDALAAYLGAHTSVATPYVAPPLTRIARTG